MKSEASSQMCLATWIGSSLFVLWFIAPFIPLAIWSFGKVWFYPDLLPQQFSLSAWQYALSDTSGVLDSLLLSTGISLVVTLVSLFVGVPAGRVLGLHQFPGKSIVELFLLAPVIVPGIAVVLGIHSVFISIGLNNTVAGVILVQLIPTVPYVVFVMAAVFANHNASYEAQARCLGATALQTFRHVTLPAILPGLMVGALFAFLVSWSQYILTLTIGGGRVITLPLLLFNFATSGRNELTGAIGLIYLVPGIAVLIVSSRYLSGKGPFAAGIGRV